MTTSSLARGKWGRVASRLSLTPVAGGRFPRRLRSLVGFHKGYLLAISPASSFRTSCVEILVRFPRNSTIRGFWDDLVADPALAAGFGRRKRIPRSRRKDVLVGDGSVLLRLTYDFFPPGAARIERVTAGLVDALANRMRPLQRTCELCLRNHEPEIYLADGVPAFVCPECVVDYQEREREYAEMVEAIPPDYSHGLALGSGAAFAFGIAAGAAASVPRILIPWELGSFVGTPLFVALGYAVSLLMSRGFAGHDATASALKIPMALLAAAIAFTTSNLVTSMTLVPGLAVDLQSLVAASWGMAWLVPRQAAMVAGATLLGFAIEAVLEVVSRRRRTRPTKIERVDIAV